MNEKTTFEETLKAFAKKQTQRQTQQRQPPTEEPVYTRFSDFQEKTIPWLWYPYLPLGRLTLLEGDPGQGKSWFALAIAASVSQGIWPFEEIDSVEARSWEIDAQQTRSLTTPAGVLYLTCEDDPEDTIKKRLRVVGADENRIAYLHGKKKSNSNDVVNLSLSDVNVLTKAITELECKLVIIDPIQAYIPTKKDMGKATDVRPLLMALQRVAAERQCAILLIRHLSKGSQERALYKGFGSIDFTASARSVLLCAERSELNANVNGIFKRQFAVAQVKNNLDRIGRTIAFELQRDLYNWQGLINLSPEELLIVNETGGNANDTPLAREQTKKFLRLMLRDGRQQIKEIRKQAKLLGIDMADLCIARNALNIQLQQGEYNTWYWALPE